MKKHNIDEKILNKKYSFFHFSICLTFVFMLICLVPFTVKADELYETIDFTKKGSITIILSNQEEELKVSGANIKIFKVATAYEENHNLEFLYHDSLDKCKENIKNGNITNEVLECVIESDIPSFEQTSNQDGFVKFENLELGLYLITQTNDVEGYSRIESFSVMIPEIVNQKWNFHIQASPKTDIIKLFDLTVKKVWNVGYKSDILNEVTIQLLKNNEVIDTITLNEENKWKHTWYQIQKSDEYTVKEIQIPDDYTVNYRQEGNEFIVTNTKTLGNTGQLTWQIQLLAVLGLIFMAAGLIFDKKGKYE